MERRARHHVPGATAATISENNVLAHREQLSPPPTLRQTANPKNASVHDRLAANIGLLRTMFKENAQRPLCPFIDDIGPAIVKAFSLTKQEEVAQVYELLVMSQRASGHPVAEFDVFCKILRAHSLKRESNQKKAKVREQQENALKGMKTSTGVAPQMNSARTGPGAGGQQSSARAGGAQQQQQAKTARTQQDWIAYLNQYSSKNDNCLSWVEFAGAIQNLPATWRRGATLEPHDLWSGRSFFMSCASVENLPVVPDSRVTTTSLSTYFVAGKMVARTARTVAKGSTIRDAMSWGDASGLAPETAFIGAAALQEKKPEENLNSSARGGNQNQQQQQGKALRLRNGSSKKWIVAHVPVEDNNNNASSSTPRLPKIKSATKAQ